MAETEAPEAPRDHHPSSYPTARVPNLEVGYHLELGSFFPWDDPYSELHSPSIRVQDLHLLVHLLFLQGPPYFRVHLFLGCERVEISDLEDDLFGVRPHVTEVPDHSLHLCGETFLVESLV